jgi:hypothetical protein
MAAQNRGKTTENAKIIRVRVTVSSFIAEKIA